jgi:hypothetical protein
MSAGDFVSRLVTLADRTTAVDVRRYEGVGAQVVTEELVPRVGELLEEGLGLLEELRSHHEPDPGDEDAGHGGEKRRQGRFYRDMDQLMTREDSRRQVADLAFLGGLELRHHLDRLTVLGAATLGEDRPADGEDPELISRCAGGLRKLRKAVTAVENALSRYRGEAPRLSFLTETQASLKVRRACAKFRLAILGDGSPEPETIRPRLQTAATALARLLGRDAYWDLRYDDRRQLRALQERILGWMSTGRDAADPAAGLRLWQDLAGFAQLIDGINKRSELEEHDRDLVVEIHRLLFGGATPQRTVPEELLDRLENLFGRDDELDRLIASGRRTWTEEWRRPLRRLSRELGPRDRQPASRRPADRRRATPGEVDDLSGDEDGKVFAFSPR